MRPSLNSAATSPRSARASVSFAASESFFSSMACLWCIRKMIAAPATTAMHAPDTPIFCSPVISRDTPNYVARETTLVHGPPVGRGTRRSLHSRLFLLLQFCNYTEIFQRGGVAFHFSVRCQFAEQAAHNFPTAGFGK